MTHKLGQPASVSEDEDSQVLKKLCSVAWIQCDDPGCLKWRKVPAQVAQLVTEDTPWTCAMNQDHQFNRCSVPEEDTTAYERMAKRARLHIITSRLKPGSLVWAKLLGYCRWPALITADPLNGQHVDEEDIQAVQYHVEFLGQPRSHGWLPARNIQVFGPGNLPALQDKPQPTSYSKRARKYRKQTPNVATRQSHGGQKVQKAIQEALQMLDMDTKTRLQTCKFLNSEDVQQHKVHRKRSSKAPPTSTTTKDPDERQDLAASWQPSHKYNHASTQCAIMDSGSKPDLCRLSAEKTGRRKLVEVDPGLEPRTSFEAVQTWNRTNKRREPERRNSDRERVQLQFLMFPSSLAHSTKEERFLKDIQMYKKNECVFEYKLAEFVLETGLVRPDPPTWQHLQVSLFSIFLAVLAKDGYLKVCERRLWPSIYSELTDQHCFRESAQVIKQYYQGFLYPFELFICGQDHTKVMKELHRQVERPTKRHHHSETRDSGVDTDEVGTSILEDDSFDSPEIAKELDELDDILKSLDPDMHMVMDDTDKKAQVVPLSTQPARKAQVVPLSTQPAFLVKNHAGVDHSQNSPEVHSLHDMQTLQFDLDFLEEEIDLL